MTVTQAYAALAAAGGVERDPAQERLVAQLDRLGARLQRHRLARKSSALGWLFSKREPANEPIRGLYIWGDVGRGKTMLMDLFFASLPVQRKRRAHFHAFMADVHERIHAFRQRVKRGEIADGDPIAPTAEALADEAWVLCFDEFAVTDIADAMILGRLLAALVDLGVVFVTTSNFRPDTLWPDGLQRERFLPAIELIERELDVVEVDGGTDYRLRTLERTRAWLVPAGPEADRELERAFEATAAGADEERKLAIEGRTIVARRRAGSAVWFDFAALCDGPRSQRDYLEIARRFGVVLLSGVPAMGPANGDLARRFTWLVDILYDHRVKLVASAEVDAEALYREGPAAHEFPRTVSRLVEMRTRDYMAEPHATRETAAADASAEIA